MSFYASCQHVLKLSNELKTQVSTAFKCCLLFFSPLNRVAFTQEGNDYFVPLLTFLICPSCLFFFFLSPSLTESGQIVYRTEENTFSCR